MPSLGVFRLKFETLLSHSKSETWNFSECKTSCKTKKIFKGGSKNALIRHFWAET